MDNFDVGKMLNMASGAGFNWSNAGNLKACWIAVFILFIIWLLSLILIPLIPNVFSVQEKQGDEGTPEQTTQTKSLVSEIRLSMLRRNSRDGFLMLFGSILANMTGYGITTVVLVLTWVVFALLILWYFIVIFVGRPQESPEQKSSYAVGELIVLVPIVLLEIVVFGLAFRYTLNE